MVRIQLRFGTTGDMQPPKWKCDTPTVGNTLYGIISGLLLGKQGDEWLDMMNSHISSRFQGQKLEATTNKENLPPPPEIVKVAWCRRGPGHEEFKLSKLMQI